MENNRLLKKFNTCFWYCLYALPLIILLLSFVGYFTLYKEKGDLIYSESELIVEEEEVLLGYTSFVPVPNTGFVENVYFDLNYESSDFENLFKKIVDITVPFNVLLLNSSSFEIRLSMFYDDDNLFYCFIEVPDIGFIYSNENALSYINVAYDVELDFVGWNETLINDIGAFSIKQEVYSTYENSSTGVEVGVYNSSLPFFSVAPFEPIYNIDKSFYDSVTNEEVLPVSYSGTPLSCESYDILYFNYYLSFDELMEICNSLPFNEQGMYILSESGLVILNSAEGFAIFNFHSSTYYFIYSNLPQIIDVLGIGWLNKFALNTSIDCDEEYLPIISKFLSPTPFEPVIEYEPVVFPLRFDNGTLFDYSLSHTVNSFDDFTLPILENALNNSFNLIGININNNISNFVVVLFAWFIQLMILHIMIDLLIFLPRLFHNYMERWL